MRYGETVETKTLTLAPSKARHKRGEQPVIPGLIDQSKSRGVSAKLLCALPYPLNSTECQRSVCLHRWHEQYRKAAEGNG